MDDEVNFFWLIRISVTQNLPGSNESTYWADEVVKKTVKSGNSQMKFHSFEILPCDVNCSKRHHSGTTLLYMRACAMGSRSPTLSHFWLLGSMYEREMGQKTKTNTYEFTEFSLLPTVVYLAIEVSDTNLTTKWIHSPLSKMVFRSFSLCSLLIGKQLLLLRIQASSMFTTLETLCVQP